MKKIVNRVLLILILIVLLSSSTSAVNIIAEAGFSYRNADRIEINGEFCEVELIGRDGREIDFKGKIAEKGFQLGTDYQIKYRNESGVVKVTVVKENGGFGFGTVKGKLKFRVPRRLPVKIKTSSGEITIKGITGDHKLKSTSGDIVVTDWSGVLEAETTSGDQIYKQTNGSLNLKTVSGNLKAVDLQGAASIDSVSGDLKFRMGKGKFDFKTVSGDIVGTDIELTDDLYLTTTSGDIDLNLENDLKELSFDLESTSGNLKVGETAGKGKLMIDRGSIMIKGKTISGDQVYY